MPTSLLQLPRRVLMILVRGYQLILSPWLQTGCRYEPTCSGYAMQALARHGALAGTYLAAHRILRCHPFCDGGHDPVPEQAPRLFRHLFDHVTPAAAQVRVPASSPSLDKPTSP